MKATYTKENVMIDLLKKNCDIRRYLIITGHASALCLIRQCRHAPPQACNSPCSVTHPVGESYVTAPGRYLSRC
jgi:hypothetical protein